MFTFLDLLVVVGLGLAAATLLSVVLVFAIKNDTARRVFFYVVSVLGLYVSTIGIRIGSSGGFLIQMGVGILTAIVAVAAVVVERVKKDSEAWFLAARITSAITLVVAFANGLLL